jgi:hypothetical protein
MRQSGDSTIKVPRAMIFGLMFAFFPGFAAVVNTIGDPRLLAIRSVDVVRLIAIGWCAGIFFSGVLLLISSKIANRTLAASDLDQSKRQSSTS